MIEDRDTGYIPEVTTCIWTAERSEGVQGVSLSEIKELTLLRFCTLSRSGSLTGAGCTILFF